MYMNPISKTEFLGAMAIGWEGLDHVKRKFWHEDVYSCEVTGVCAFTAIGRGLGITVRDHYKLMDRIMKSQLDANIVGAICGQNNASESKEEAMAKVTKEVNEKWPEGVFI